MYRKGRHFKDPTCSKVKTIRSKTNFILGGINYLTKNLEFNYSRGKGLIDCSK